MIILIWIQIAVSMIQLLILLISPEYKTMQEFQSIKEKDEHIRYRITILKAMNLHFWLSLIAFVLLVVGIIFIGGNKGVDIRKWDMNTILIVFIGVILLVVNFVYLDKKLKFKSYKDYYE
jgi:di/tricarboxylate transporter